VWDQFPHAIEYLVYAYLQKGADGEAAAQVERMAATKGLQPSFITAFHLASTPARYALERRAWAEAMALAPREPAALDWDRFTWPEAVTWFARGLGAAHEGKLPEARAAAARLAVLDSTATAAGEALFARSIRVLHLELRAWLAQVGGDPAGAASLMREAVALELATPKHAVTPAPTIPAQELLGDLLLEQGHAGQALAEYKSALEHYPRRFNGLLGAARAARKAGNEAEARRWYDQLLAVAGNGGRAPALAEARPR
jgi:tetratricopeptide (TPR) repeat protein